MYFPFAHNDLLQLAVELGLIGTALCPFAAWRVGRDLVGAHLLGRGRCPVGGGEDEGARRSEASSVGVGLGAVTAVLALSRTAPSTSARGSPPTACSPPRASASRPSRCTRASGPAPTAAHGGPRAPSAEPAWSRARWWAWRAWSLDWRVPGIARAPLVESSLEAAGSRRRCGSSGPSPSRPGCRGAVGARPPSPRLARRIWDSGQTADGRVLASWAERRREALPSSTAPSSMPPRRCPSRPSDPFLHDTLGWAHAGAAAIDEAGRRGASGRGGRRAAPGDRAAAGQSLSLPLARRARPEPARAGSARSRSPRPGARSRATRRSCPIWPAASCRSGSATRSGQRWCRTRRTIGSSWRLLLDEAGLGSAAEAQYRRAVALGRAGHRGAGAARPSPARWRGGAIRGRPRRARHRAPTDPDNPELHLARAGSRRPRGPGGARCRPRRARERRGARRPARRWIRRRFRAAERGRRHSRSARSARVNEASRDIAARSASS